MPVTQTTGTTTTPAVTVVRAKGPAASAVSRALTRAGHRRAVKAPGNRAVPTPGFVARQGGDTAAYVTVFATMHGLIERYRAALEAAGFVVEDHPYQRGALAVYASA